MNKRKREKMGLLKTKKAKERIENHSSLKEKERVISTFHSTNLQQIYLTV